MEPRNGTNTDTPPIAPARSGESGRTRGSSRRLVSRRRRRLLGHATRIFDASFEKNSPEKKDEGIRLATASEDASIRVWNVTSASQRCVRTLRSGEKQSDEEMLRCSWSPSSVSSDKTLLAAGSSLGCVFVWNVDTGETLGRWSAAPVVVAAPGITPVAAEGRDDDDDKEQIYICCFGPESSLSPPTLLVGGEDTLREVDVGSMRTRCEWTCKASADVTHGGPRNPDKKNYVFDACYAFDGTAIAVAAADGAVHLRDLRAKRQVASLLGHRTFVAGCAVDPLGRYVASCAGDGTVCVWDCRKWSVRSTFKAHDRPAYGCSFLPNVARSAEEEPLLLTWSADGSVRFWDASLVEDSTVQLRAVETFKDYPIYSCAIAETHDGLHLACGGGSGKPSGPINPGWVCDLVDTAVVAHTDGGAASRLERRRRLVRARQASSGGGTGEGGGGGGGAVAV